MFLLLRNVLIVGYVLKKFVSPVFVVHTAAIMLQPVAHNQIVDV